MLTIPDYSKPFVLFVIASNVAVSAALSQCDENNLIINVAYMSRKLSKCQCNYSVVEKELHAIVLLHNLLAIYQVKLLFTVIMSHYPI